MAIVQQHEENTSIQRQCAAAEGLRRRGQRARLRVVGNGRASIRALEIQRRVKLALIQHVAACCDCRDGVQ